MRFTTITTRTASDRATSGSSVSCGPVGVLLGGHSHIRHFMQLSRTLSDAEGVPPQEIADAAKAVFRYFSHALPQHEADENEILFPRLRATFAYGNLVREAAETMVEQHKAVDELIAELLSICASLGRQPNRIPSLARSLDQVTRALDDVFTAHFHLEETVVFPAVQLLTRTQVEAMSREMHRRRQPPLDTIHLVQ